MESVGAVHEPTRLTIGTIVLKGVGKVLEKGVQIWCTCLPGKVSDEQRGNIQGEGEKK